jgi:membrane-associated PAP2 superfamily phosphatase
MKQADLWVSVSAVIACVATACVIVVPPDLALKGLAWVTLALSAAAFSVALVVRRTASRSTWDVIQDVEGEPQPALARSARSHAAPKGRDIL